MALNSRTFLKMVAGAATVAAVAGGMQEVAAAQKAPSLRQTRTSKAMSMSNPRGGHLYMQTNETRNAVIHFRWSANGTLTEVERTPTGGAGSGTFDGVSIGKIDANGKITVSAPVQQPPGLGGILSPVSFAL